MPMEPLDSEEPQFAQPICKRATHLQNCAQIAMARGFVAGGLAFGGFGFICAILTAIVPMWLVSRTELVDQFCWFGEGIFITSYRWGDDIPALKLECSPQAGQARSSFEAYCAPSTHIPTLDGGRVPMTPKFRDEMCTRTNAAQVLILAAIALGGAALACGMLAHATSRFKAQLHSSIGATLCAATALMLEVATFVVMQTSPLFDDEHIAALASGFGLQYKGVSCMYQMPSLHSIWEQRNFDDASAGASQYETLQAASEHEILSHFRSDRHYSLYGAFRRRWRKRGACVRHLINTIPPLLNIAHAVVLGLWIMNGTAFGNLIRVDEIKLPHNVHFDNTSAAQRLAGLLLEFAGRESLQGNIPSRQELMPSNFTVIQHMIDFSPITTLQALFDGGAVFIGLIILVSIFIWPCIKVLIWSILWYAPADEVLRGRLYSWLDALGKISLANLYILAILCVSNYFERDIVVPWFLAPLIIQRSHALRVRISFAIQPGFGTYGYAISAILSLLMGQANLSAHRLAKSWEERRREESTNRKGETRSWVIQGSSSSSSSSYSDYDNEHGQAEQDDGALPAGRLDASRGGTTLLSNEEAAISPECQQPMSERRSLEDTLDVHDTLRVPTDPNLDSRHDMELAGDALWTERSVERQVAFYRLLGAEACQNHIFSPTPGTFYRCTLFGKAVVLTLLVTTLALMGVGLSTPIITLERSGIVGDILIPEESRNLTLSVVALPGVIQGAGLNGDPPGALSFGIGFFVIAMPLVHLVGLVLLWLVPWAPSDQVHFMRAIEVLNAWSAVDVFCLMIVAASFDLRAFTTHLIENGGFLPLDQYLEKHIPHLGAFTIQEERLLPGFGILVAAVVLERFVGHVVRLLFATMIAERRGLREIALQARKFSSVLHEIRAQSLAGEAQQQRAPMLSNSLLRTNMAILSPTTRYVLASAVPSYFYAGLPLCLWRALAACGMLQRDYTFDESNLGVDPLQLS
ncbi:Hypothetical Protein FCC1311_055092 [Hondaea fermentalgiana]|uniref:Uncharacterized protein n=1 Tax=Hondaea fermentalgiana TaxID=2315210 RepID=A0A2R5GEA8_9STRA|nr:Hypothetical Protein FCC1311_055092 [Hondaea fermentalgiana]|eukprot:GBG29287.1 Hypothetical Protein FCC1311_055092 [Hondaea fermentalgiana]